MDRIDSARRLLSQHHCTHLLVTDVVDVEYLSGFASSHAVLVIAPKRLHLFTDFRYKQAAEAFCAKNRAWRLGMIESGYSFLLGAIAPGSAVAFQSDCMTVDELQRIRRDVRKVKFVPVPREVSALSLCRTPAEIASMRKAASIGDRAFTQILPTLREGISERELAAALDRTCSELGSAKPSFDTIVLFGSRSSMPHGHPGPKKLRKGDFVLFDFGCTVAGLFSDMTRTVVFGRASSRQREVYEIVKLAQTEARHAARAGIDAAALDAVARSIIANAGYGDFFGHGLGHGVGRRVHESPRLSPKSKDRLEAGNVVTIEPGIYLPGFGGVRIEDMACLTPTGSRLLTASPRDLIEL